MFWIFLENQTMCSTHRILDSLINLLLTLADNTFRTNIYFYFYIFKEGNAVVNFHNLFNFSMVDLVLTQKIFCLRTNCSHLFNDCMCI